MTWNRASGVLTHTGATRDFYEMLDEENVLADLYEIRAQSNAPADNLKVVVRTSHDGGSCLECGIEGANLIIRAVTFGVVGAAIVTIAHGIGAGVPLTLRVRQTNEGLACAAILATAAPVEVQSDTSLFRSQRRWGLATNVNGAVVPWVWNAALTPIYQDAVDVLTVVAGGDLYACTDGQTLNLIAARVMPLVGLVSLDVQDGKVWIAGGGKAKIFDPVALSVVDWVASDSPAHDLPGAVAHLGTTATIVRGYRGGLCLVVDNLVYRSAIADPLMWNTAELAAGAAWVIGGNVNRTGLNISDHILCLSILSENALFIGGVNSSLLLLGDPGDGAAQLRPLSDATGISGPNAIALVDEGRTVFHSPEGLYTIPAGGTPRSFSDMLNTSINFPRAQRQSYAVTLIRDPARMGLHVFISTGTAENDVHFWYDESGGYKANGGGFFPESYPWVPTCACIWRGEVLIGTKGGLVVKFSDNARSDVGPSSSAEGAQSIDSYCSFSVIHRQPRDYEALIDEILPEMGIETKPYTVTLYGATTPERMFGSSRYTLATVTPVFADADLDPIQVKQRSPVCMVEIRGPYLVVEALAVGLRWVRNMSRASVLPEIEPGAPCTLAAVSGGGGGGGGGISIGPGSGPAIGTPPPGSGDHGVVIE